MDTTMSSDGTLIAYDRTGEGPALILVTGALGDRADVAPLAAALAASRGSGDTQLYAVDREIDDLAAMIRAAGGRAFVLGHSSGAALALEAAARGLAITKLALYEPPYIVDESRLPIPHEYVSTLGELVGAGRRGEAVEYFWRVALQLPPEMIAQARTTPMWPRLEALAHTLSYDGEVMGDHMAGKPLPAEWSRRVTIPTLVIDGGESPASPRNAVAAVAQLLPNAQRRTLQGQGHGAPAGVLAPVLEAFFRG